MQNVEFKSEIRDLDAAAAQCAVLDADRIGVLRQTDVYYKLADGRLKRRTAPDEPTVWIYYHRPDDVSPRVSNYTIMSDPQARRRWGTASLRPWLRVVKTRHLWMLENVRIHLDDVEDLGRFIEFEAVVSEGYDLAHCHAQIAELRRHFAPVLGEAISVAYCDLMAAQLREGDEALSD